MISSRNVHGGPSSQASGTRSPGRLRANAKERAAGLDDQRQRPIEQRPRQPERCAAERVGGRRVGVAGADQHRQDLAIGRIGQLLDLGYRDAGRLRLAPLAVLAALPRPADRARAPRRHRRGAIDHVGELRVGEARRASGGSDSFSLSRELAEKLLPLSRAARLIGGLPTRIDGGAELGSVRGARRRAAGSRRLAWHRPRATTADARRPAAPPRCACRSRGDRRKYGQSQDASKVVPTRRIETA